MINYNQTIPTASFEHCYGIAKLLELMANTYSKFNLQKFLMTDGFIDATSTLIDIHPTFKTQVTNGLIESNLLINTPSEDSSLLYKLERSLSRVVRFKSQLKDDQKIITCNFDSNLYWDYPEKNSKYVYLYCYFLRSGYTVSEELGKSYYVIEPLGVRYSIDSYSCSCCVGILDKKCLHLQLIDWYKQSKLLKKYGNY